MPILIQFLNYLTKYGLVRAS